nr:MAG TPA: hypothetical protein [Caudoviricetes sp.]
MIHKREVCPLFYNALNWYKSSETLLYNYGMRKGLGHVQSTEKL